jgi:hypothetical protein
MADRWVANEEFVALGQLQTMVPEPVKLFETDCQEIFGATSAGCGLLIHAAPGSCGGVGALFTNRSGWAA